MERRTAIRNAILGLGAATNANNLFKILTDQHSPDTYHNQNHIDWAAIRAEFVFEDGIRYFNQASLGTSPASVIDATETFRRTLESYPSKYMWSGWDDQKELVRDEAADLLKADSDEIALIHNTTEGMNVVAASLNLGKGDEVIVGDHEHRTGTSPWLYHQEAKGIEIIRPELPVTPNDPNEILHVYEKAITKRTKVISMVHMTNTNGMILPIRAICNIAQSKGIITVIDAAQSMGVLDSNVHDLGCDFYTASGHKWLYGPKGMGIFYAKKDRQELLKPFIANRSYTRPGLSKIEDYNTRNLPELLGMGAALKFHKNIGLNNIQDRLLSLRNRFIDGIGNDPNFKIKTPLGVGLSYQILTVEKVGANVWDVRDHLLDKRNIDVRPMSSHDLNGVRVSFSIFHDVTDVDYLIDALKEA